MLRFSPANAKIRTLREVASLQEFLSGKRKVYSFDILSGHTCPYAKDCKSMAVEQSDGRRVIVDGPDTDFRCFSASQEVLFTNLYRMRKANTEIVEIAARDGAEVAAEALQAAMPSNAGIIRIHVGVILRFGLTSKRGYCWQNGTNRYCFMRIRSPSHFGWMSVNV